jgi:hypothetical protein
MRQYDSGCYVSRVLGYLHKPRSHEVPTIIHNMSVVTEGSEQDDLESSFKLPLYKYIELDEEIIDPELIEAFNHTFPVLFPPRRNSGRQVRRTTCRSAS